MVGENNRNLLVSFLHVERYNVQFYSAVVILMVSVVYGEARQQKKNKMQSKYSSRAMCHMQEGEISYIY